MDPNSTHQMWSRWAIRVSTPGVKVPSFQTVKLAAAKLGRLLFGSASAMRVTQAFEGGRTVFTIDVRTEGSPVHDTAFVAWMTDQWTAWARKGFGAAAHAQVDAKVEAGDRQDGKPREQLIMIETLAVPVN
jgi:hypothetical protein